MAIRASLLVEGNVKIVTRGRHDGIKEDMTMSEDKKMKEEELKEKKPADGEEPLTDEEVEDVAGGNIFRVYYEDPDKAKGFF